MTEKQTDRLEQIRNLELVAPASKNLNSLSDPLDATDIQSEWVQELISRMRQIAAGERDDDKTTPTMVGLAAPQLGENFRVILVDFNADGIDISSDLKVLINPRANL